MRTNETQHNTEAGNELRGRGFEFGEEKEGAPIEKPLYTEVSDITTMIKSEKQHQQRGIPSPWPSNVPYHMMLLYPHYPCISEVFVLGCSLVNACMRH